MYIYLVITLCSSDNRLNIISTSSLKMGIGSLGGGKSWVIRSTMKEVGVEVLRRCEFVELMFLWWHLVVFQLEVAWEVSVVSVMDIISSISVLIRVVESI